MALINALLVRSQNGWSERLDAASIVTNTRFEAYLALGAVQTEDGVNAYADAQLDIYANPREEVVAGIAPIGTVDLPYVGYRVGDTVTVPNSAGTPTVQRVRGITVTEDDDTGIAVYTPQFKDLILQRAEQVELVLKKMSNGTLSGSSMVAQPIREQFVPREVTRDAAAASAAPGFDAIVDPDLSADSPSTLRWKTVGNAIRGLKVLAGGTFLADKTVTIGVTGRFTSARATETQSIADADCPARVNLIGLGSPFLPFVSTPIIEWSDGGFAIGGTAWSVANLRLITTKTTQFFTSSASVTMVTAATQFTSSLAYVTSGNLTALGCFFENAKFNNGGTQITLLSDCHLRFPNSSSTIGVDNASGGGSFVMMGGSIDPGTVSRILQFGANVVTMQAVQFAPGFSGGSGIPDLQFIGGSNQHVVVITSGGPSSASSQAAPNISASGTPGQVILIGSFGVITLPAPASGRYAGSGHHISGELMGALDLTGPASVHAHCGDVVIFRGSFIKADIVATVRVSSGTAITGETTLTDSSIDASVRQLTAVSTQQAYNFKTGSARNLVDIAGASLFTGTASTDTGTANLIRTT